VNNRPLLPAVDIDFTDDGNLSTRRQPEERPAHDPGGDLKKDPQAMTDHFRLGGGQGYERSSV